MGKQLHYDGVAIDLQEGQTVEALMRSIEAVTTGSGWLPLVDSDGVTHHLRIGPTTPLRFTDTPDAGNQLW